MANRGKMRQIEDVIRSKIVVEIKMRQIEDVIRSKIVVEIGVFYYRCPFVTLGDLECRGY